MNMRLPSSIAAITLLSATTAMASPILIDDFTAPGSIAAIDDGNPAFLDVVDAGILGGTRGTQVSTDNGAAPFGTSLSAVPGLGLNFDNGAAITGQASLVYDGGGPGVGFDVMFATAPAGASVIEVDTVGLGGEDFLLGNDVTTRAIEFSGSNFGPTDVANFQAFAWDLDGDVVRFSELIGTIPFTETLGLTEFALFDAGGDGFFDWENVGAIAFTIESVTENFDGTLGSISVVPLPASALFLLGSMGGLAGGLSLTKRRRRKAA